MRPLSLPALALLALPLLAGGCAQRFAGVPADDAQAQAAQAAAPPVGGVAPQTTPHWGGAMPPPFPAYGAGAPRFGAPVPGGVTATVVSGPAGR